MSLTSEIFVLCDYTSVSQEQKLSINGIFDRFYVDKLPLNWPRMFLVTVLKGEPRHKHAVTFKVSPPPGVISKFPDKNFDIVLGNNGKFNLITELVNFPLQATGVYQVLMDSDGVRVGELQFEVIAKTKSHTQPTPTTKTLN